MPGRSNRPLPLPRGFVCCPGCGPVADGPGARRRAAVPADTGAGAAGAARGLPLERALRRHRADRRAGRRAPGARPRGAGRRRVEPEGPGRDRRPARRPSRAHRPAIVIAATAFSAREDAGFVLDAADCPVLQAFSIGAARDAWERLGAGHGRGRPRHAGRPAGIRRPALRVSRSRSRRRARRPRASPSAAPCRTRRASRRWPSAPPPGSASPACPAPSAASPWCSRTTRPAAAARASPSASTRPRARARSSSDLAAGRLRAPARCRRPTR